MKLFFSYFSVKSKLQKLKMHKFDLLLLLVCRVFFFLLIYLELQEAVEGILAVHSMNRYKI